jgi:type II secretory pathway component PulF
MPTFKYQARDSQGKLITQLKEAESKNALISQLRQDSLFVINIEEVKPAQKRFVLPFATIKARERVIFTRGLSHLLDSGIVLSRALHLLASQAKNPLLKQALEAIHEDVAKGGYLWQALERHPKIFPPLYVSTVKAAEQGGGLEKVIRDLADYAERRLKLKDALTSMLVYPLILLSVGAGTVIFLMIYVIPKMLFIFEDLGESLPFITKLLIGLSLFAAKYWWVFIVFVIIAVVAIQRVFANDKLRKRGDEFLYKAPIIGPFYTKVVFAHFTRILAVVLANNVSILESLDIARQVIQNKFISDKLEEVSRQVSGGSSLSLSLSKSGVFTAVMVDMIAVAEETGRLEEALLKVASTYQREVEEQIKRFLTLLEPALIVILALAVGFIVMAVLLPVFQMNLQIL